MEARGSGQAAFRKEGRKRARIKASQGDDALPVRRSAPLIVLEGHRQVSAQRSVRVRSNRGGPGEWDEEVFRGRGRLVRERGLDLYISTRHPRKRADCPAVRD